MSESDNSDFLDAKSLEAGLEEMMKDIIDIKKIKISSKQKKSPIAKEI